MGKWRTLLAVGARIGRKTFQRSLSQIPVEPSAVNLQAILRPFIFSVHPDLFYQHPGPKKVNEASLKTLNEYIQSSDVSGGGTSRGQHVQFYQRHYQSDSISGLKKEELKVVQVKLEEDRLKTVRHLLKVSQLSLDAVDKVIESHRSQSEGQMSDRPIKWMHGQPFSTTDENFSHRDVWEEVRHMKPDITLHRWISTNINKVRQLEMESRPLLESYSSLYGELKSRYNVNDIIWNCGWRGTHRLASLKNLQLLINRKPVCLQLMAGKKIIFGTASGVSFNGDIALCSDEVSVQWEKAFDSIENSIKYLKLIPDKERQLSSLLGDIQVVRRKTPPFPMAPAYYYSLANLIGKLGMSRTVSRPTLLPSLEHLQVAITGSMGDEITLTPEGHISVPSHSPVWVIYNFIKENEQSAVDLQQKYRKNKLEAEQLMESVKEDYKLKSLGVDMSVSYDQVITCCKNLLVCNDSIRYMLEGVNLVIAPYFAIMSDGDMYIMWDWVNDL